MSLHFVELAYRKTRLGELSLRRRHDPLTRRDVYEVKLNEEFLMSSLFTRAEEELASLGLAAVKAGQLDVLVGGLGLGYTAATALADARVRSLTIVETLAEVIEWHRQGLVPLGRQLTADRRCHFMEADFFACAMSESGFDAEQPGRRYHAILLDIDHSPEQWLHAAHATFYQAAGLRQLQAHLQPGGVFAMWSNDLSDANFLERLKDVFHSAAAHIIRFPNPYQAQEATASVYVATARAAE